MKRLFWTIGLVMALSVNVSQGQESVSVQTIATPSAAAQCACSPSVADATPSMCAPCASCSATAPSFWNQLEVNGYVNAGFFCNTYGSVYNGNANKGAESGGALNAMYLSMGKAADNHGCGFDYGFKMDFAFGEDTRFLRVNSGLDEGWYTGNDRRNNDTYGFAMPQLYMDVAMNNWLVRAGHFYTPLGYETARADERFFYTLGLTFDALPIVQSGAMIYYKGFQKLELGFGWVNGLNEGFDGENGGSMAAFTAKYNFNQQTCFKYAALAGDVFDQISGEGKPFQMSGQLHSFVLESKLNCCLTAVTTIDYQKYNILTNNEDSERVVLGQHFYRQINDYWKLGLRLEWQKDNESKKDDSEFTSLTVGANWRPTASENLVIRPEMRYDKSTQKIYNNNTADDQIAFGMDVMLTF